MAHPERLFLEFFMAHPAESGIPAELIPLLSEWLSRSIAQLPPVPVPVDWQAMAYVWEGRQLRAVEAVRDISLNDLLGIDRQKQQIVQNTRQFLAGLPANNVLLTGARGGGKSSLIRALLHEFAPDGLRLIEVARDDLHQLPHIRNLIRTRPEKFIVYCDDLAFSSENEDYRALKSALDGSLQSGERNLLLYATSNRRHLLPEFMDENLPVVREDAAGRREIHPQEAIEEKVSLSDRFGLWLPFHSLDQDGYLAIVQHGLQQAGYSLTVVVQAEALRWAATRGQRSGRAAAQFVRHWVGQQQLAEHDQAED
jgi:hypothetical protein